jgi:hypothetical protein
MGNFLLASQRLTRSQGETPYHYFELYLVTVAGFHSVALVMMDYYARYHAIAQQNLATLFPFLDDVKDHLTKTDPASPFLGAAKRPHQPPPKRTTRNKQPKRNKEGKGQQTTSSRTNHWGPTGAVTNLAANTTPQVDAQLAALTAQVAALMAAPNYGGNFGMPVYSPAHTNAILVSSARPRRYYCWLHGWNNSHDGVDCKVMTNDMQYTAQMCNATSEIGSGGNPKIGVPVTYTRPSFFLSTTSLLVVLPLSPLTPSHTLPLV